ncbi:FkbM family methyltransferase [Comamonas testosteroni]|uniref:FkbM family methyltransferase n=1 Tax=Comamonas testosteroni TaxID=285 RepID=UPI001885332D|nr:FkbM family methyltransferase [Comamonas testosteroni]
MWSEKSLLRNQLTAKYEPVQPFLFLSFLKFSGAQVVLDVGANVGIYSLTATLAPSVESIYAFEPDDAAYKELELNVLLNGADSLVKPVCAAVSDSEETLRFGSQAPMAGVNGVVETSIHDLALFVNVKEVNAVRLDSFLELKDKVLGIKIDVEGHELNVIAGAAEVLKNCSSFVQVEHYMGNKLDDALAELGYFRFFAVGYDHYFTNIRNFANSDFVKRAAEHAMTWLVESQSDRWPHGYGINNSLTAVAKVNDGVIEAEVLVEKKFFAEEVEYAFYLMKNGKRVETRWYQDEPSTTFPMVNDAESIEVKCFVRQKNLPEKKVVTGVFIKRPSIGFRAESAVENSYDFSSKYVRFQGEEAVNWLTYPEVDLAHIYQSELKYRRSEVLYFGGDPGALEVAANLVKNGRMGVICMPAQWVSLTKSATHSDSSSLNLRWHPFRTTSTLKNAVACLERQLLNIRCVILRYQFLADIAEDIYSLRALFVRMPAGAIVYADALVNLEFRQSLLTLTSENGLKLEWLNPRSSCVPVEWLTVKQADELKINEADVLDDRGNPWIDEVQVGDERSEAWSHVLRLIPQDGKIVMHLISPCGPGREALLPLDEEETVPRREFSLMRIGSFSEK